MLITLIVLYVTTQLGSTLMMQQMSPQMDKTQRQLMMVLPLLFVVFVINFPAGLLVYWITTNAWTMAQQFAMLKIIGPAPVVATPAGADSNGSGAAGGIGALLRRARGEDEPVKAVASKGPAAAPPPPPRKKKKRSGRRR